jgi:ABC-2 type transport system permease protein
MNRVLLFLIMLPSGLWKRLGADIAQLQAILKVKLMMDNRKPLSFGNNKGMEHRKKKDRKYTVWLTMFLSFFMGIMYVLPIIITKFDTVIGLTFFYTMFVFVFTFTLITDFANVLIDTKDKFILFPRPVTDRTIMLSRLLYIMIYLLRLVIPMSIPAWIVFGLIKGWKGALFFPVPVLLMVFVVLFLVSAMYIIMLRVAKPGRFKDVLNYFQIIFSIVFFAVWMLSSRMINPESFQVLEVQAYDWVKYFPTYWMATCWTWVDNTAKVLPGTRWMSVLAIVFPFVSLWATVRFLAPAFIKSLVASDNSNEAKPVQKKEGADTKKSKVQLYKWAEMLNKNNAAKAGFILTWLQTSRSRNFKMRVYPSFAYVPVYFFFILMQGGSSFSEVWEGLSEGTGYIGLLYLTTFVMMQAINYITMSEQYKSAWVYYSAPVEKPGEVIAGAYKAMWVKYFLPFMAAISAFTVVVWGGSVIFDVIIATVNITLFSVVIMRMSNRALPFSRKEQIKDSGLKTIVRVLGTLLLMGVLAITHLALVGLASPTDSSFTLDLSGFFNTRWLTIISFSLKLVLLILSSIFLWLVFDSLKNTDWKSLQKAEQHI